MQQNLQIKMKKGKIGEREMKILFIKIWPNAHSQLLSSTSLPSFNCNYASRQRGLKISIEGTV